MAMVSQYGTGLRQKKKAPLTAYAPKPTGFAPRPVTPTGVRDPGGNPPTGAQGPMQPNYDADPSQHPGGMAGYLRDRNAQRVAGAGPSIAPAPPRQYGFNPTPQVPGTKTGTFDKAANDFNRLPGLSQNLNTAPNPQDLYKGLSPEAQAEISRYFGGGGRVGGNQYLDQGMDYLNNAPPLPGSPEFGQNPTSYRGPQAPGFNGGPTYDNMNFDRFDSSQVGGPGQGQFTDPRAGAAGIAGPETDYGKLYGANAQPVNRIGGFGPMGAGPGREAGDVGTISREGNRVGREDVRGSNFENNQGFGELSGLSTGALRSGLGAARGLAAGGGFDVDNAKIEAAYKRQYEMAAQAGGNKTIGRGFSPSGGTVGGVAIGKELGNTMAQLAPEQARLMLEAASGRQRSQIAGMEGLQGIGATAGGFANTRGGMLQNESQFLGSAGLRQRDQDIAQRGQEIDQRQQDIAQRGQNIDVQGQRITERGQDINRGIEGRGQDLTARGQDINQREQDLRTGESAANRGLDIERLRNENYQSQTQRMTGMGQLVNQMEEARANNNVQGYNAATQRLQTEYGYSSDQARNQIAGYQAATQRGEVGQRAWAESQKLGFDYAGLQQKYDELAANNVNLQNRNLVDVMQIMGNQANDRLDTVLGSMGDYGKTLQAGQIENMRNAYQRASLATEIMGDSSQAAQYWTDAIMNATGKDREAYIRMWETWVGDQTRKNEGKFDWGGLAGDVVGAGARVAAGGL